MTGQFNKRVEDFNSRCGSFTYRASDMTAVDAEMSVGAAAIRRAVTRTLGQWRPVEAEPSDNTYFGDESPTPSTTAAPDPVDPAFNGLSDDPLLNRN